MGRAGSAHPGARHLQGALTQQDKGPASDQELSRSRWRTHPRPRRTLSRISWRTCGADLLSDHIGGQRVLRELRFMVGRKLVPALTKLHMATMRVSSFSH